MKIAKIGSRLAVLSVIAVSTANAATSPVGRSIKFYETSTYRVANFVPSSWPQTCTPSAQQTCITLDQYGTGRFNDIEIASVAVSGSFGRSTLCTNQNVYLSYVLTRPGLGEDFATFTYTYRYELYSAVLNDLSLINPRTGLPYNGKISFPVQNGLVDQDVVGNSHRLVRIQPFGSFDCGLPLVNYSMLVSQYGLSSFDAQRVMGGGVTIKQFISGQFISTEGGTIGTNLRMIGD